MKIYKRNQCTFETKNLKSMSVLKKIICTIQKTTSYFILLMIIVYIIKIYYQELLYSLFLSHNRLSSIFRFELPGGMGMEENLMFVSGDIPIEKK